MDLGGRKERRRPSLAITHSVTARRNPTSSSGTDLSGLNTLNGLNCLNNRLRRFKCGRIGENKELLVGH
jgi:hypothetical protein